MGSAVPIDELIRQTKPHLLVLEVCAETVGTNAMPPRARVRIVEVLYGALAATEGEAVFAPDHQASWYAIRDGGDEGLARWNAQPCPSPATGTRVIVAADLQADGALAVWARSVRPDDEHERTRIRALLGGDQ